MEKYRAIPKGYMRIGELAKKAGISINALRYYDKEGLLSPSLVNESKYRLYTDQDLVKLIQIQTMKELGFSLSEIKKYIVTLDSPDDMVAVLTEHETAIEKRIEVLSESLKSIKALKEEVTQIQTMDFKRYADILVSLQMKNDSYWAIKYMDEDVLERFRNYFDEESAPAFMETMENFYTEAMSLHNAGTAPESEQGQSLAKKVYELMLEVTGNDTNLMIKFAECTTKADDEYKRRDGKQAEEFITSRNFMQAALEAYAGKGGC